VTDTAAVVSQPHLSIEGVVLRRHVMHRDHRGSVAEIFWSDGDFDFEPRQWHVLTSVAGSLGGMHLHVRHWDRRVLLRRLGDPGGGEPDLRPADEFGFRWNDPELGVEWPAMPTYLSKRDLEAESLASLVEHLRRGRYLE
jgi:dTDP-4-dehydrorhamnose 3,5-epimerase-like enzyme